MSSPSTSVHVRLPVQLAERLDREADRQLRTRSSMVTFLLDRGLSSDNEKKDGR
jgi:metal-responsive CopG/Arc/MetJ family transcriptional regulator